MVSHSKTLFEARARTRVARSSAAAHFAQSRTRQEHLLDSSSSQANKTNSDENEGSHKHQNRYPPKAKTPLLIITPILRPVRLLGYTQSASRGEVAERSGGTWKTERSCHPPCPKTQTKTNKQQNDFSSLAHVSAIKRELRRYNYEHLGTRRSLNAFPPLATSFSFPFLPRGAERPRVILRLRYRATNVVRRLVIYTARSVF